MQWSASAEQNSSRFGALRMLPSQVQGTALITPGSARFYERHPITKFLKAVRGSWGKAQFSRGLWAPHRRRQLRLLSMISPQPHLHQMASSPIAPRTQPSLWSLALLRATAARPRLMCAPPAHSPPFAYVGLRWPGHLTLNGWRIATTCLCCLALCRSLQSMVFLASSSALHHCVCKDRPHFS